MRFPFYKKYFFIVLVLMTFFGSPFILKKFEDFSSRSPASKDLSCKTLVLLLSGSNPVSVDVKNFLAESYPLLSTVKRYYQSKKMKEESLVEIEKFLKKNIPEAQMIIEEDEKALILRGEGFIKLNPEVPGLFNAGVYESLDGKKIIKFLSRQEGPHAILREIFWAIQAQQFRGPRFLSWGHSAQKGYFIVIEKLFAQEEAVTFKAIWQKKEGALKFLNKYYNKKFHSNMVDQMAENFVLVIKKKIVPIDTDFMVSSNGDFRWMDLGLWNIVENRSDIAIEIRYFLQKLDKELKTKISESILNKITQKLKESPEISEQEIKLFLEKYRNPRLEPGSYEKLL